LDPAYGKEVMAKKQGWDENTRLFAVIAYKSFTDLVLEITWKAPK